MRATVVIACGLTVMLSAAEKLWAQAPAEARPSISAAVSDQQLQFRYDTEKRVMQARSDLGYGVFLAESRALVASANLMLDTDLHLLPRLRLQVGPQVYAALLSKPHNDALALAIGARARYDLIPSRGIAVAAEAFYSPDVLTFGTARNAYDFAASAEIRLFRRMTAFAGYRWFKFTLTNAPDERLQNELFAGLRWVL
ncbi:MAG: YfaZ family protein [Gammaproteobacteria bacterium]|nr:YfaZ family protein [Gammaproteobacteria bacterium]